MMLTSTFCVLFLLSSAIASDFTLQLLPTSVAEKTGALCLDGSSPGYYYRPGTKTTAFRVHFRGGGWCFTELDCYWRSQGYLGTSKAWPPNIVDAIWGFMSNQTNLNPDFADWNTVYIEYCDGTSFTSDRDDPVTVNGTKLYFRGKRILDAIWEDLDAKYGFLSSSTDIVLTGTSAGGLATYLHAEYLYQKIYPRKTNLVAMPDAGFFLDHATVAGVYQYRELFQGALNLWNGTGGVNQDCIKANRMEEWKCFMAQYTVPHITHVPVFVINSLYDTYQIGAILQLPCDPSIPNNCSARSLDLLQRYRDDFQAVIQDVVLRDQKNGAFLTACLQHEESCQNADFMGIKIDGQTALQKFSNLYFNRPGSIVAIDVRWPNNPSCSQINHGPC